MAHSRGPNPVINKIAYTLYVHYNDTLIEHLVEMVELFGFGAWIHSHKKVLAKVQMIIFTRFFNIKIQYKSFMT